ncbi:hypothetical protein hrd7_19530 [Leptolinea sp. HRD-7]|nr:hypothetical protein hrd7_19530 [Leptolinea sp. HRD-7]
MNRKFLIGIFFLLAGVITLFANLGYFSFGELFGSGLLLVGGLVFLYYFAVSKSNWWAAIPGCILFSVGVTASLPWVAPGLEGRLGGPIVLAGISLAFWLVYLRVPTHWWAIIPAGVMLTLASITLMSTENGMETGGVFFIGLGLTFALVALLPGSSLRMAWPWIPAAVLIIMGFLFIASAAQLASLILPAAMIIAGIVLTFKAIIKR